MVEDILLDAEDRMEKSIEALQNDLRTIRTGRASPALVEHIPVMYYGMPTPLQQLAVISVPEPRLITVRPFNAGDIGEIQKAILKSELGITPTNDGKIIRLVLPPLTEERRRELVRQVHKRVEEAKVSVRNIRRDANKLLETAEKEKTISEDELHDARDEIQEMLDRFIERIEKIGQAKEAEIMEV
ncbi:MAG: ribosome recycling factor [Anaerolineae bacterium]|nr:ribosome recycling factor [Anaerolineae bacterium]